MGRSMYVAQQCFIWHAHLSGALYHAYTCYAVAGSHAHICQARRFYLWRAQTRSRSMLLGARGIIERGRQFSACCGMKQLKVPSCLCPNTSAGIPDMNGCVIQLLLESNKPLKLLALSLYFIKSQPIADARGVPCMPWLSCCSKLMSCERLSIRMQQGHAVPRGHAKL